jgi:prepilin-type N-terminal cleavage/methylation domain-containing protein
MKNPFKLNNNLPPLSLPLSGREGINCEHSYPKGAEEMNCEYLYPKGGETTPSINLPLSGGEQKRGLYDQNSNSAFTLIELAIVVVVLGILVSGVVAGRSLISVSQSQGFIKQMESYQTAILAFKLEFDGMPGDFDEAEDYGIGSNGNGDGYLGLVSGNPQHFPHCFYDHDTTTCLTKIKSTGSNMTVFNTRRSGGEHQLLFSHLSGAGLINSKIVSAPFGMQDLTSEMNQYFPKDSLGKNYLVSLMWNRKLYIRTGIDLAGGNGPESHKPSFTSKQVKFITEKMGQKEIIMGSTNSYPNALNSQSIIPLGVVDNGHNSKKYYLNPDGSRDGYNDCVVFNGSKYIYNISENGDCNLLWEMKY